MPTDEWWNVHFDKWNEYQSICTAMQQPGNDQHQCSPYNKEDCISLIKLDFMLKLYKSWNQHQENLLHAKNLKKIQYLTIKIQQRSPYNKSGIWLYYLHRSYVYAQMGKMDAAKKDVFEGCIANQTNNDTVYNYS